MTHTSSPPTYPAPLARMSRIGFWFCLTVVLGIFLLVDNPLFNNPFAIDDSILWSYAPIPLLVLAVLLVEGKLSLGAFFLDTLLVTLAKFGVTYILAVVLWAAAGSPPPRPAAQVPLPSVPPLAESKEVSRFLPSAQPTGAPVLEVTPEPAPGREKVVVKVGERVLFSSPDKRLHTVSAHTADGRALLNWPVVPGDGGLLVEFHEALGPLRIGCTVHGARETWPMLDVIAP